MLYFKNVISKYNFNIYNKNSHYFVRVFSIKHKKTLEINQVSFLSNYTTYLLEDEACNQYSRGLLIVILISTSLIKVLSVNVPR